MTRTVSLMAGAWLVAASAACSSEPPPPQSADILAEVLAEAGERNAAPAPASVSIRTLPATFLGVLPCVGCPGVRVHLNLFEDRTFLIRSIEVGRNDRPRDDIGTWTLGADRRTLTLNGGRQAIRQFVIKDDRHLRQLDFDGREVGDDASDGLVRSDAFESFEPSLLLQGLFTYVADAGLFTDCLTRQRWPVATESANAELERTYLQVRQIAGAEVLVEVEGRLALRPPMEGDGPGQTLVVDRVIGAWPNRTCGMRIAAPPLDRTSWRVTHLNGEPVDLTGLPLEPYLDLRPGRFEFAGSDGCNRVVGTYAQEGDRLQFRVSAVTRIGCPEGNAVSRAFSDALSATEAWLVSDDVLELVDGQGRVLARFVPQR